MLKLFIVTYEQGYAAGLRRATVLPGERDASQDMMNRSPDKLTDDAGEPAYQEGFADGFRDGLEALAPPWGWTSPFTVDGVNVVSLLQRELRDFFLALRRHSKHLESSVARLHEILARAEAVMNNFPAEGTETGLEQRRAYVQLVSLIESARQALAYNGLS